jgi:general secretion pathway protein A
MYEKFYNLKRSPFEVSPDPYFFYSTPQHNEALALLNYGIARRKGFVVVAGEVGTGKSLLVRCLLDSLTQNRVAFAYIYNPILSVQNFLEHVLVDLGLPAAAKSKNEALTRLNNFLLARSRDDLTTALVVDEAQLLSWELLEEIRLLTNLETTQHKLLQIILVGQPELDKKLNSHELRQLKQRIGLRYRLAPLSLKEAAGYIQRRLELASEKGKVPPLFSRKAVEEIYAISKGIPRLINTLCENSLTLGFGLKLKRITPEMVREVAADFCMDLPGESTMEADRERAEKPRAEVKLFEPSRENANRGNVKPIGSALIQPWEKSE